MSTSEGNTAAAPSFQRRRLDSMHEISPTAWMVTFSDLLTLLITLFVLRLSMSSLDNQQIIEQLKHYKSAFAEQLGTATEKGGSKLEPLVEVPAKKLSNKKVELTHLLADKLGKTIGGKAKKSSDGTALRYNADISLKSFAGGTSLYLGASTFLSGSDELSFQAQEAVITLSKTIRNKNVEITIAGHTDSVPIFSARFPSNWELSTARALAVVRQMIDSGVNPRRISAVGYSDTRPIADNQTELGRHLNRRVEIHIAESKNTQKSE